MCMKRGSRPGWVCMPGNALRIVGNVLAVLGALLIVVFVPFRYWMALIGLILLLAGLYIRINC